MDKTVENIIWFAALIYFAPAILALIRGHVSFWAILVLNVALGWTLLGWFVALIWSLAGASKPLFARPAPLLAEAFAPDPDPPSRRIEIASGEDLDALARRHRVMPRQDGEPDQAFRIRIMRVVNPHGVWI